MNRTKKKINEALKKANYPLYYFLVKVNDEEVSHKCYSNNQRAAEKSMRMLLNRKYGENNYEIVDISVL